MMPTSWIFQTFVIILPIFRDIVYICISIICINSNRWKLWIFLTFKFIMQGVYIKEILFKSKSRGFRKGLREGLKKSVENSTFASEPPTQPPNVERNKKKTCCYWGFLAHLEQQFFFEVFAPWNPPLPPTGAIMK